MQHAQRVKHVVVQVAAKHKRRDHCAQLQRKRAAHAGQGRYHPAFEPGKALPFAALGLQIFFQRAQRDRRRPGVAIGPQRQIDTKHKAMLGGLAHQCVQRTHQFAEIFLVGDAAAPQFVACSLALAFVDVNQVDVAGHIELARAKLAHGQHAQAAGRALEALRLAVAQLQFGLGLFQGGLQRPLGQVGHGLGDLRQRHLPLAIEP